MIGRFDDELPSQCNGVRNGVYVVGGEGVLDFGFVVTSSASRFSSRVESMMNGQSGVTFFQLLKRIMMRWTVKSRS